MKSNRWTAVSLVLLWEQSTIQSTQPELRIFDERKGHHLFLSANKKIALSIREISIPLCGKDNCRNVFELHYCNTSTRQWIIRLMTRNVSKLFSLFYQSKNLSELNSLLHQHLKCIRRWWSLPANTRIFLLLPSVAAQTVG